MAMERIPETQHLPLTPFILKVKETLQLHPLYPVDLTSLSIVSLSREGTRQVSYFWKVCKSKKESSSQNGPSASGSWNVRAGRSS